jgi:hypothetical protein
MLQHVFFWCCNTYFLMFQYMFFDVALYYFVMLQFLYSNVALHSFYICLWCCTWSVSCSWDRGRGGGKQGALGNRDRGTVRNGGQGRGGRNSIPFYSDSISICVVGRARPDTRITVPKFTRILFNLCTDLVVEQYSTYACKTRRKKSVFPPSTFAKVRFSSLNSKIGQTTSFNFWNHAFYLPDPVISGFESGFIFFFFIYFGWIFEKS